MSDEKLLSEFNEAIFQISRLHNVWLECKSCRERGNLLGWKWKLDTASIELFNDAKRLDTDGRMIKGEKKEKIKEEGYLGQLKKLDEKINEAEVKKQKGRLYNHLMEKEKLLREIQEESGKGAKFKSSWDDGI